MGRSEKERLRTENKTLRKLLETTEYVNSSLSIEKVLNRAMETAENLIGARRSSIWEIDEEKKELFFRLARGVDEKAETVRLKIGEGIAGCVARDGESVIVKDPAGDPRWSRKVDREDNFVTRSLISVPLKIKDEVTGVIQLVNKEDGNDFNQKDLRHLEMLSNQIAVAIENAKLYSEQKDLLDGSTSALAKAIEMRDTYTGGHTHRVLDYSLAIGRELELSEKELEYLKYSALLHDIGKIGVEDSILHKKGPLDTQEEETMSEHARIGAEIVEEIDALEKIRPGIVHHHERFDGNGYPAELSGNKIPLQARIIAVADTFDAMTTSRPYREGLTKKIALKEIKKESGTQFCPAVVEAFLQAYESGNI